MSRKGKQKDNNQVGNPVRCLVCIQMYMQARILMNGLMNSLTCMWMDVGSNRKKSRGPPLLDLRGAVKHQGRNVKTPYSRQEPEAAEAPIAHQRCPAPSLSYDAGPV